MKLFIAEKPSLAQAIAAGISDSKRQDGYISLNGGNEVVTWCYGHVLEQLSPSEYDERYKNWSMSDLPIIPNPWRLKVNREAAKQFKIIRELIGRASTIVNAGDPDREGQLLVDEVLEYVGNKKPVQRILLNALDEKSVRQSLKNLKANDEFRGLKLAALGRSRADLAHRNELIAGVHAKGAASRLREHVGRQSDDADDGTGCAPREGNSAVQAGDVLRGQGDF